MEFGMPGRAVDLEPVMLLSSASRYRERRFVSCAVEITTVISVAPVWRARLALAGP
jgi:hypothetical protein